MTFSNSEKGLLTPELSIKEKTAHIPYVFILIAYLALFSFAEILVPSNSEYWVSYMKLDDYIPFVEQFVIFYDAWYFLLFGFGFYFLFFDGTGFKRYLTFIGASFSIVVIFCIIFPNGQNLRPNIDSLGRDNFFIRSVANHYLIDTNTNVLPSMHVIGSFAWLFAQLDSPTLKKKKWLFAICLILTLLVSASTVFIKQHSILDVIVAIPYSFILWALFYKWLFPKIFKYQE